ncbi:GGDEF domain-containing protein [Roseovarius gahaiensis]|uniref:diguanylate cyclase n=1 Tax=Roseovarius gahaiensis TaxID=2716691 RepID=A0A967EJ56_9RHOB|nr:GGDEF domain-containing protein [Roseovarius gahaiensis]NHQ73967.1 GGDEF domain-containing protein [Roseovarius gahaiensis]
MQLRLSTRNDVRLFTAIVVVAIVCGSVLLNFMIMPPDLMRKTMISGAVIAMILSAPVAYFVGTRLREIHDLNQRLRQAISFDPLTGAHTRTNFHSRVAQLRRGPMSLIIADIDHFKAINDRFGHQAGDTALQQFANALMDNCRASDIVARFGGEEFVILMPATVTRDGLIAAERLCQSVRACPITVDGTLMNVTASFGIAGLTDPARIEQAIRAADLALYRAKAEGRNRVCLYDPHIDKTVGPASATSAL